ncbi:MAG: enoyl-CoA hydratase [Deltaproteobacteria bacterium]|nr:enoyl-CoA hydratase [Deltaproteobacteria bacterium]
MSEYEHVLYENIKPGIARITQNRPEVRNAQDLQMTYDLNAAFDEAAQDDGIKVIILTGADPHFSAGHDLRGNSGKELAKDFPVVGSWAGFKENGAHGRYARESEIFLEMTRRWRNLPKPTIAQVSGKCIAGGLMLAWACDIIIASDDAMFQDPVVSMGVCGVEFFMHPWELGPRKAKELLFTADWWTAQEAHRLGMVNHVVPRPEIEAFTLELAEKIASKPLFALKMSKRAVNHCVDASGQQTSIDAVFEMHQLCHAHNEKVFGLVVDPAGFPSALKKD